MLTPVFDANDRSRAFRLLEDAVVRAGAAEIATTVGFPGGNMEVTARWLEKHSFWVASKWLAEDKYRKYWNAFGVQDPRGRKQVAIAVEINFPATGKNRNAGGVAKDSSDHLLLVHSGRTGGRRHVPISSFWSEYDGSYDLLKSDRGEQRRVACFRLDSPGVMEDLARFVWTVARLKGQAARSPRAGLKLRPEQLLAEELLPDADYPEGAKHKILVNAYERNPDARKACLQHHGPNCMVCGMNFSARYGPEMAGFIHVHHIKPLAQVGKAYRVDPVHDLRPVCPNCHAVIHRFERPLTIEEVRNMLGLGRRTASHSG